MSVPLAAPYLSLMLKGLENNNNNSNSNVYVAAARHTALHARCQAVLTRIRNRVWIYFTATSVQSIWIHETKKYVCFSEETTPCGSQKDPAPAQGCSER